MFSRRKQSGGPVRHLGDDELLVHLDGELPAKAAEAARIHLQECWECHSRSKLLDDAVTVFMQKRGTDLERAPRLPLRAVEEFEARLHQLAVDTPQSLARRVASALELWRPWAFSAAVLGLAVFIFLRLGSNAPATVSAKELLHQIEQQETAGLQHVTSPVVYQKLRMRKPAGPHATMEVWSDRQNARVHQRGDAQSWKDLENIYRRNGFRGAPLSPAAFLNWRNGLVFKQDEVTRSKLADGSDAIRLRTSAPGRQGAGYVQEATLVIRARDMHPVEQQLRVGGGEYELTELSYQVLPLAVVGAAMFEPPRMQPTSMPPSTALAQPELELPRPPISDPPTVSLDDAEVEAQYVLHQLGACRGEEVAVGRSGAGRIRVSGIVNSTARKQEMQLALAQQAQVDLELRSVEEVAAALQAHQGQVPDSRAISVHSQPSPIERELKRHFASAPEGDGGVAASVRFANSWLSRTQSAMLEAWALRRLADRYGPRAERNLRAFSTSLLTQMAADHNRELGAQLTLLNREISPVLEEIFTLKSQSVSAEPAADWAQNGSQKFTAVRRILSLTQALLAGDNSGAPPQPAVQELLDRLHEFESQRN